MHEALLYTCMAPAAGGGDARRLAQAVLSAARSLWHADARRSALAHDLGVASWEVLNTDFSGCVGELGALRAFAARFRVAVWTRALQESDMDPGSAAVLADAFRGAWRGRHRAYPEVHEVLERLRGRYTILLLTNGPADLQREKIHAAGLEEFFDQILISGELGFGKPDPSFFEEALRRSGVRAREALMFGDSLERDILGARGVGIRGVRVERSDFGAPSSDPDLPTIRDLHEISPLILGTD